MKKHQIFINGKWTDSHSNEFTDVLNPATEEVIGQVASGNQKDVDDAVAAAKEAFTAWNALDSKERMDYVEKILQGIEDRKEELAQAMVEELGCTITFARETQVPLSINEMKGTLEEFKDFKFEEKVENATVMKEGVGVVACITPWNYPLNQIQRKVTPALLAGNTIVVKPASVTPLTALIYTEIIEAAGIPKGVYNLVTGGGSSVGDYLAAHEDVALISFTGSTEVGRGLYEKAGPTIKKMVLELGGKSAMVYLKGGDLEAAIEQSAETILGNSGQSCSALSRLLVPEDELEKVKEALSTYFSENAKVGDPTQDDVKVGPVSSENQLETVLEYIKKGKAEGAEAFIGGNAIEGTGYYVEPTVFINATNQMTIAQEEIFGPVLVILTYKTVEEAIQIANDSPYGLSGAVVGPEEEALKVARQLRTGNVFVNNGFRTPKAPFGGYKESGIGRENGIYGVEDYLELKALFI